MRMRTVCGAGEERVWRAATGRAVDCVSAKGAREGCGGRVIVSLDYGETCWLMSRRWEALDGRHRSMSEVNVPRKSAHPDAALGTPPPPTILTVTAKTLLIHQEDTFKRLFGTIGIAF